MRDRPSGAALLALGRQWLLDDLLPLLPAERHRELRLVAAAMAIAEREAAAGDGQVFEIGEMLVSIYAGLEAVGALGDLLLRLAADLRDGAFETCEMRRRNARALLWQLTMMKLREGNPQFLADNGFGD